MAIKRPPLSGLRDVTKPESVHPFGLRLFLAFLHLRSPSFIEGEKVLFSKERSKHVILPYDFKLLIKKNGKNLNDRCDSFLFRGKRFPSLEPFKLCFYSPSLFE